MNDAAGDSPPTANAPGEGRLIRMSKRFDRAIATALVAMLMLVVALSTLELAWKLAVDIFTPPVVILTIEELLDLFGFFLLILVGFELMETVKAYLRGDAGHVEIVLDVALIAISRKVIVLELSEYPPGSIVGIAVLVVALAIAIAVSRRARKPT